MAESNDPDYVRNTGIVRQLLANLNELSSRISSPQTSSETEAEVRRVFTGHLSGNAVNVPIPSPSTSMQASTTVTPSSNVAQVRVPNRSFVMRRNFSGQRPSSSSRRQTRQSRQRRPSAIENRPFLRDLVLLGGPDSVHVPRQGARLALMKRGHMISGCRFTRGMNEAQVEIAIMEALGGKIPDGVDIEILMSMHTSLVTPSLAPGQEGIDGAILQRLFQSKPIYIRPSRQIIIEHQV